MPATISIIVVNYNGKRYLEDCFNSLMNITVSDGFCWEVIMVDNQSEDGSVDFIRGNYPDVKVLENNENNFAKALNLGIMNATGDYVALLNNDMKVEREWIQSSLQLMLDDESIGAVQSKIRFMGNNRINSAGVEEVEDFYFRDIGFDEEDKGQYEEIKRINYFSGGAVLLKKECLDDVGEFDEDFIMYFEDVDYSIRCSLKGWKIYYNPHSVVYHKYQGSASAALCEYLCSRNRFFCMAKHYPFRLSAGIKTSHFYRKGDYDALYNSLLFALKKMFEENGDGIAGDILDDFKELIVEVFGYKKAYHFFSNLELILGLRKIKIGIYDHAFHFAGGGQRYVANMAQLLKNEYDITYIANKDISLEKYKDWFDIDLSGCGLSVIKIPFYEQRQRFFIDEGMIINENENPFDIISKESLKYDIFINANMLSKVKPLSVLSVFVCHFPDRGKEKFFCADKYDYLISNGSYTSEWIKKRWGIEASHLIYPPVDMYNEKTDMPSKGNVILSVARFEMGGSKKQLEMINAYSRMCKQYPYVKNKWKLILAGGSFPDNPYYNMLRERIKKVEGRIELRPDVRFAELKELYSNASIFWHACGLNENSPELIEHFGMTTVEAMQNYCVPIVFDGGGQREIVEQGVSGFRFQTVNELQSYTNKLIMNKDLRNNLARQAYDRSHDFNLNTFQEGVIDLFNHIREELVGLDAL